MLSWRTFCDRPARSRAILAYLAVTLAAAVSRAAALDGVLVLDNGNVLSGAIERVGDDYVINVTGATMQVPVDQVERFARTLEEAYEQRRVTLVDGTADRHLELAAWCLRLELFDQAARELLDARRVDPQLPGIDALERRLRWRLELAANRGGSSPPATDGTQAPQLPAESDPRLPPISVDAQARFVRSIQPMLIHSCSTAGCHQPGADHGMRLDRWALEGRGSAEIVRRNLAAVRAQIDPESATKSTLLAKARVTHGQQIAGGAKPLSARQLAILTDWISSVTIQPTDNVSLPLPLTSAAGATTAETDTPGAAPDADVESAAFVPRDAFDPEILNRRRSQQARLAAHEGAISDPANSPTEAVLEESSEPISSMPQSSAR